MGSRVLSLLVIILVLGGACDKVGDIPKDPKAKGKKGSTGEAAGEFSAILAVGELKSGGVQVQAKDHSWSPIKAGAPVPFGAPLKTSRGARARLVLQSGNIVHLNEDTTIQVDGARRLKLVSGSLLAEVRSSGKSSLLDLETPAGKVRVTGTKLHLMVEGDTTFVDVARGSVEVHGAASQVEVGAGERAVMKKGSAPRVSLSQDLAYVTRWAREVGPPGGQVQSIQPGFGSLKARAPGQRGSRPLRLARHAVRVKVRDNIARTEIEQHYYNPTGQTLEGTFSFPLPPDASISRLALYVGNRLEEGEIVERKRARRIFRKIVEDTIRPRDPALLEWVGGRTFRMKIFPIPPRSARRVILAYTQALKASYGRYRYVYPMATSAGKATRVGKLTIEMEVDSSLGLARVDTPLYPMMKERQQGRTTLRYEASDFKPAASFVAEFSPARQPPELQMALFESSGHAGAGCAKGPGRSTSAARIRRIASKRDRLINTCADRGGFFMAVLRPELPVSIGRVKPRDYLFLLDSSHSAAKRGWALQTAALEAFLAEMDLRSRFNIMACDASCRVWGKEPRKPTTAARQQALSFVRGMTPGGASNLQVSFHEAAARAAAMGRGVRVVYMGDGRPTAGELREPELARMVTAELSRAGASLDVLQIGEDSGDLFLAEATRGLAGAVHRINPGDDLASRVFDIVAAQYRPTLTALKMSFEGELKVHDVYPRQLPSLTAGGEVIVVGRYNAAGAGAIRLQGRLGERDFNRRYPVELAASVKEQQANHFIPRIWAQHHLEALAVDGFDRNRPEIVRVSKAYTVMSQATSFLVLENERMYREFGVKRQRQRNYWKGDKVATSASKDSPEPEKTEALGKGGLGLGAGNKALDSLASTLGGAGTGRAGSGVIAQPPTAASGPAPAPTVRRSRGTAQDLDHSAMDEEEGSRGSEDPSAHRTASAESTPRASAPKKAKRAGDMREQVMAKALTRSLPAKPASAPKPKPSLGPSADYLVGESARLRRRRPYRPRYRWVNLRKARIQPLLAVSTSSSAHAAEQRLRRQVQDRPLHRWAHKAYHKRLVLNGNYGEALSHATRWAQLDADRYIAHRALADMLAAAGKTRAAVRAYTTMVEVNPYSARLHRYLAEMYRNKGDQRRSCSHLRSVLSLRPSDVSRHLALARCLASVDGEREAAVRVLTDLSASPAGKRHAGRIGRALAALHEGATAHEPSPRTTGALVVSATWDRPVDLDLVLISPRGDRVSALLGARRARVERDSLDGRAPEVLRLTSAPTGAYRVEIARGPGVGEEPRDEALARGKKPSTREPELSKPISGTILVRALGQSRTIPFMLGAGHGKPLASVTVTTQRVRRPYRYYR